MLQYQETVLSSGKKSYNQSAKHEAAYFPTASRSPVKSSYNEEITLRTPTRTPTKMEKIRESVDEVIQDVSAKRSMNKEAINEVQVVNHQIIDHFGRNPAFRQTHSQNQYSDRKEYGSGYQDQYNLPGVKHAASEFRLNSFELPSSQQRQPFKSNNQNEQYQNSELRRRLNEELQKSSILEQKLFNLEHENSILKSNYGPTNSQDQVLASRIAAENEELRLRLRSASSSVPSYLVDQMEDLKLENQRLRADVSEMLRRQGQN